MSKIKPGRSRRLQGLVPYGEPFYNTLREYDAILVPNLSGEQPRVIFDAMANAVVVIGSNIRSLSSIIKSGVNGILCNPRNPKDFASAIQKLYEDKELQERIIHAGIKTIEENTIESIHMRRMKIIDSFLRKC